MGFIRKAAQGGLFGLGGLIASKSKNKDKPQQPALIAKDETGVSTPSLISHPSIY